MEIKKLGPFDYTKSICEGKSSDIMTDAEDEKAYTSFVVNRALSYHNDCVFLVNEVNGFHMLDNRLQYDFLRLVLKPRKRFSKWAKKVSVKDLDVVKEYYGYSDEKAMSVIELLSKEDLKRMKNKLDKGGRK